ncbi:hypothetical protein E1B28_006357 [Marasmius oreades]|uniref:UPF3 domain-containing protein n=1 Tax=Marasmius oreades TaxID=181124 RepID=A0A9P7S545_9AGAR|nr:uncharacterized protein E1B28_006357 [Marasmius oreades]KAG7095634.1 hypothetical protein E1B28_006357 [Marasmius oreades]
MATSSPSKSKKDKKEKDKSQQKHGLERLKIVIRRLPPNLPEGIFWQSVHTWVSEETVTWKRYHQGKFRSRLNKENVPSRAYVAFKTEEQLASFHRDYDGHLFRDKSGNESQAVVEFAPYQKIPSEKKKADARIGTIEQDEDYISFIQSLNQPAPEPPTIETLVASTQTIQQPKTTPLLEALKAEKIAAKEAKEAKEKMLSMRSHAHPPEVLVRKDDMKKKGPSHKFSTDVTPTNKKVAKKAAGLTAGVTGGDSANSGNAGATGPRKPPRAPRAMREQLRSSASQAQSSSVSSSTNTTSAPVTSNEVSTPPARRPVLGLGSRQFEAALSGVAGGKTRKEREKEKGKEKEKEKDKEKDKDVHEKKSATKALARSEESGALREATFSKRERSSRHRENTNGGPTVSGRPQPPISGILQRGDGAPPAILLREQKPTSPAPGAKTEGTPHQGPQPGPGRGRGRGRGRGGRGGLGVGRGS